MLTGRNAKNYRTTSGVSIGELIELIDIDTINRIEDDCGEIVDNDIVMKYYRAINAIKQNKSTKTIDISEDIVQNFVESSLAEDMAEVKTRKHRQPKTKS